jgi:hypothetical protein
LRADDGVVETSSNTPNRRRLAAIAVLAAVLLVGGIGVAVAQTGGSSTTIPSPSSSGPGPRGPRGPGGPGGPGGRFKGGPGPGFGGPRGAIHGEFVAPDGSGGYRTVDMQMGDVTSVSSDSISVKSVDGFSKTYSVDQNTVVNSGRDGIGSVKNGDKVSVNAVVDGGKAAARNIQDLTTLGQIRQHWNPKSTSTTIS